MNDFTKALTSAFDLIARLDPELVAIVSLSLRVSLTASLIALVIGAPFAADPVTSVRPATATPAATADTATPAMA